MKNENLSLPTLIALLTVDRAHSATMYTTITRKKMLTKILSTVESKSSSKYVCSRFRGDGTRMTNYRDRRRSRTGGWKKPRTAPIVGNDHDERGCRPG